MKTSKQELLEKYFKYAKQTRENNLTPMSYRQFADIFDLEPDGSYHSENCFYDIPQTF